MTTPKKSSKTSKIKPGFSPKPVARKLAASLQAEPSPSPSERPITPSPTMKAAIARSAKTRHKK